MSNELLDDEDYATLLYHAAEDQLSRYEHLEHFVEDYSPTLLELVVHLFASVNLPDAIHHEELEPLIQCMRKFMRNKLAETGTNALPYHDDVLFVQFFLDFCRSILSSVGLKGTLLPSSCQPWKAPGGNEETWIMKSMFNIYPDFIFTRECSSAFQWFASLFPSTRLHLLVFRFFLAVAKSGHKVRKLSILYGMIHSNTILPPENGYTRMFPGNESVTEEQLRDELLKRNESIEPKRLSFPFQHDQYCISVAVSYKHFAGGSKQKVCQQDIEALHRFLVASRPSEVRFWIDSRLPFTEDASFDRWLKRGVRPYARYFTFVCPSAYQATERFWIQMERHIAMASQGIFSVTDEGIYFRKKLFHYRTLCHKMLTLVIGRDRTPPGMRGQDEGKMVQWALGFLGDKDGVKLFRVQGPRVDSLCNREFSELNVMRNITYIIKEHGEMELPVEAGRSWNKDNPLILGGLPDQILLLPTWIGFAKLHDPRKVYFLNGSTMTQVVHGGVVGLEITLRKPFRKGEKNEIIRKVLRDIRQKELLEVQVFERENGEEICVTPETRQHVQKALLGYLKRKLEDEFFANSEEDERRRDIQKFVLQHMLGSTDGLSDESTEETEEQSDEPKNGMTLTVSGMKAVAFAWECDWE